VDLRRIQTAHEGQDLLAEDLAGYQYGESWRVRGHKRR
jgi:hypothetical protein